MAFEDQPWLLALALIPPLALMIFIWIKDKHKDSFGILFKLFLFGVLSIIPAIIWELIGDAILKELYLDDLLFVFLRCFLVIGPAEEISKYLLLKWGTWKNKKFDYSYNGIVFAVFVSLGFAALENVLYVAQNGMVTGIVRALTSIPGHACFAIFMGLFYARARYAYVHGKKAKSLALRWLAIISSIILHGLYDFLLMAMSAVRKREATPYLLGWLVMIIVSFVWAFIIINKESKHDYILVIEEPQTDLEPALNKPVPAPVPVPAIAPVSSVSPQVPVSTVTSSATGWTCNCGTVNYHAFCASCGSRKPMPVVDNSWSCPNCGSRNTTKFCSGCGTKKS